MHKIRGEAGTSASVQFPRSDGQTAIDTDLLAMAGIGAFRLEPGRPIEWTLPVRSRTSFDQTCLKDVDHFRGACHPDDFENVILGVRAIQAQGGQGAIDFRLRAADRRWLTLRVTCRGEQRDGDYAILGLLQDFTELNEARDAALRVEQQVRGLMEESRVNARRLKLALSAAQAGVFEIDHEQESFWCSPEFVLVTGRQLSFSEANLVPWTFVHHDDRHVLLDASRVWMTGTLLNAPLEIRIIRPDGAVRWVRLYYELKRNVRGQARRSVGLMLDIDERKRQELALIEAQQAALAGTEAKSRFLASVSHEIRTPMNGILGVLHLLKDERLSPEGRGMINEALGCGKMLSELINDVLDFSKIEADQLELSPEPTDPMETLKSVVNLLAPQCEAKGLYMKLEPADELQWVMTDPVRLRQTLFNLLGNAVKFTLRGGVTVRVVNARGTDGEPRLRFEIADTGIGIPREARDAIFNRFQQADSSTTRRFGGTGLGLAITKRMAELMGGGVSFDSTPGVGSTFRLEIAAPPAERVDTLPEELACLDGVSILVVEDNATNRMIVSKILQNLGACVDSAEDGEAGVAAMSRRPYDLVLMDVQMPVMDGLEATRRIRRMAEPLCATPIIALTANVLSHQRDTYLAAGMDGVVAKPISPAALIAEISRLACALGDEPEVSEAAA